MRRPPASRKKLHKFRIYNKTRNAFSGEPNDINLGDAGGADLHDVLREN